MTQPETTDPARAAACQYGLRHWREPTEVMPFKVKTLKLDYPGRTSFGALTTWEKAKSIARFIFRIPLWLFGIIFVVLLETTDFDFRRETRPGTVHVDGHVSNPTATDLIDSLSKAQRSLIVAFSSSHFAFFEATQEAAKARPVWESPPDARVRFGPVWPKKISVDWPDGTQAWIDLTDDQHTAVVEFFLKL